MVEGIMTWTSTTGEFGLVTPDDGSRVAFVRFTSAVASSYSSDGRGGFTVTDEIPPTQPRHQVASKVEVRTRYQGQWASGYEIAQVVESGYKLRRPGALDTLPDIFVPADVRHAATDYSARL
jgi:cold shock CspA family protein